MFWIGMFLAAVLGIVSLLRLFKVRDCDAWVFLCIVPTMIMVFIMVPLVSLGVGGGEMEPTTHSLPLVAINLRGRESASGSFFLGCGTMSGSNELVYYYCQKSEGGISVCWLPIDRAYIVEDPSAAPCVRYTVSDVPGRWSWMWGYRRVRRSWRDATFVVPPGSVTHTFSVDVGQVGR